MRKSIYHLLITASVAFILANLLPKISIDSFVSAIILAVVLAILKLFVRPVLIFITLPATIITFGLFLLVINTVVILMADSLLSGFKVGGFWAAFVFSFLLSLIQSVLKKAFEDND